MYLCCHVLRLPDDWRGGRGGCWFLWLRWRRGERRWVDGREESGGVLGVNIMERFWDVG